MLLESLFQADRLAIFMAYVSGFVSMLILIYSIGYTRGYSHKIEFFSFVMLFLAAMAGLIFSRNLLLMYIFWEITAFCSWRLIGFYRNERDLWCADKAFLVTFFGASAMLVGLILIYLNYGTFNFDALRGKPLNNIICILLLFGIFSKSAQLPFSSWLPDAGVAPTPVTALLHAAVLVKIGVYAYARLFNDIFIIFDKTREILLMIILLSGFIAAASALLDRNIKRILAYSTVSQLSYIFLGLLINNVIGITAALLYILVHSIGKAGLFLSIGIVEQSTHQKNLDNLGGLINFMPIVAFSFLLSAFSIIGLPPFGGFFSKFYVILAAVQSEHIFAAILAILTAVFTLLYLIRLFDGIFLGEVKTKPNLKIPYSMITVILICGLVSLAIGLFIQYPLGAAKNIAIVLSNR
ncbi:MAG: NADH-quinone oxidoreductase subunit L [Candidatus Omnitrophica bacterium]|jgi:NADH:ubiquinone oxidoreductase subunit 5 (subunit L)/multisubunit Na+/H+ antiporter MnhA subunit|nr:NADH-quinone oxidoreductase subunit L [Candidatus Omnitrophota bacterium]